MKKHSKLTCKFRIKIYIPILFNISVLLDVQANLPETSPFLFAQMALVQALFSNVYSTWDILLEDTRKQRIV